MAGIRDQLCSTKVDHFLIIVNKFKPHVVSLTIWYAVVGPEGYNIKLLVQRQGYNMSRQILLIDVRLNYDRKYDLEGQNVCCHPIWQTSNQ